MTDHETFPISIRQVERAGNIPAIAVVQRLDRIVELLEAIQAGQANALEWVNALIAAYQPEPAPGVPVDTEEESRG